MEESFLPTGRILLDCFRAFEAHLLRLCAQENISMADLNILRHLDPQGMSITALALDVGVSKQAVSRAVAVLQDKGMLRMKIDPRDGRARTVHYTAKGRAYINSAITHIGEMEAAYEQLLGEKFYKKLRENLLQLQQWHQQHMDEQHA